MNLSFIITSPFSSNFSRPIYRIHNATKHQRFDGPCCSFPPRISSLKSPESLYVRSFCQNPVYKWPSRPFSLHSYTVNSLNGDQKFHEHDLANIIPNPVVPITLERAKVVAMLALALALCNADRVVMSVAIIPLSIFHGWSTYFTGIVQSSFLWGYMISPVVGGLLVDIFGGKVVLAWGVGLWSAATCLTPWASNTSLRALLVMRFLLGIAEGVALPGMNNIISRWFSQTERSKAVGVAMAGFQLGNAMGLMLSPVIMSYIGIAGPFFVFGLLGFLWAFLWMLTTPKTPELRHFERVNYVSEDLSSHPNIKEPAMQPKDEQALTKLLRSVGLLLQKKPIWAIISANAMHSWGYFIILSWAPIYLNMIYGVDLRQAAWFSALPWTIMAIMGYFAGVLSDLLIRRGCSITFTRKIMQFIGFLGPASALLRLNIAQNSITACAWLMLALGLKSFGHSGFLVNMQEIAPEYTGVIHGMANTVGTLAAIVGTVGAGFFLKSAGSFRLFLVLTSVLYILSALFWGLFSSGDQIVIDVC